MFGDQVAPDDVIEAFNNFKLQRDPHKLRYFVYKISDDKKFIEIEHQGDRSQSYDDFCEKLSPDECRYGLVDLEFKTGEGGCGWACF